MLIITRVANNIYTRQYLNGLRNHRTMKEEIGWKANERMGETDRLEMYQ